MSRFIEFMQNTWVIGIVGGIISGIIVYYITIYVLDRKKKSDHKRDITYANNAVLDILRPYIANSGLPSKKELEIIINSISRHYGVKNDEMYSITSFYEDLVLEFIGNMYIPNEMKKENIEKLLENIDTLKNETAIKSEQEQTTKEKTIQIIGALFGTFSAIVSILSVVIVSGSGIGSFNIIVGIISVLTIIIAIILGVWTIYLKTYRNMKILNQSRGIKEKGYYVDRDFFKMTNCGTNMKDSFNDKFSLINYFKGDE